MRSKSRNRLELRSFRRNDCIQLLVCTYLNGTNRSPLRYAGQHFTSVILVARMYAHWLCARAHPQRASHARILFANDMNIKSGACCQAFTHQVKLSLCQQSMKATGI